MSAFVPAGDPEAMRATARALVAQAEGIRLAPEAPVAAFEALVLEGPAAGRLQLAAGEVRNGAQQAAAGLEAVAARLQADAALVEQMNEEPRIAAAQAAAAAAAAAADEAAKRAAAQVPPSAPAAAPETAPPA
jgi:hypothetical protein